MADLHEALKYLSPVSWSDVPQDDLSQYVTDCLAAGELICNSVPSPDHGTPFASSHPHFDSPNTAKSHQDVHPSSARAQPPHPEHEDLQSSWGKPMKLKKADNPLDIHLYKMAGKDRHGGWFARKSVHEGIGFDKFRRAMMREFPESMAVSGGPGAGAVRGIAADRRLEHFDLEDKGVLEAYELSAKFPGPVTPREFITLLITSSNALTEKSAVTLENGKKVIPRNFMIVSRPISHPDAPERAGLVRGQYESVELIREIPLHTASKSGSKSTPDLLSKDHDSKEGRERGKTLSFSESRGDEAKGEKIDVPSKEGTDEELDPEAELNPVEWIMISRSDPGGGIPRFLVDRGTPDAMIQDVHKFFNWACAKDYIPTPDEQPPEQTEAPRENAAEESQPPPKYSASDANDGGIMSTIKGALESGAVTVEAYVPTPIANMIHTHLVSEHHNISDDSSDTASVDSFLSASEMNRLSTAQENQDSGSSIDLPEELRGKDKKDMNSHEKELLKIAQKRDKLDKELLKKRQAEEDKLRISLEKDDADAQKSRDKIEKELKKAEEKHNKEMEKLQKKRDRELQKAEERRNKKHEHNKLSQLTRERDEFRSQSDLFKHEIEILRKQVAELQTQNSRLDAQVKAVNGSTTTLQHLSSPASRSSTTESLG